MSPRRNPREITEDEHALMNHVSMWGSDGYPICKAGRGWVWGPWRSVKGPPVVFKTKREATVNFEAFINMLADAKGEAARQRVTGAQRGRSRPNPHRAAARRNGPQVEVRKATYGPLRWHVVFIDGGLLRRFATRKLATGFAALVNGETVGASAFYRALVEENIRKGIEPESARYNAFLDVQSFAAPQIVQANPHTGRPL